MVLSVHSIPADIIYAIIDEICTDAYTLRQCSLVSRSFLPHSHKHLFSTIQLDHPVPCRGLYRVLMNNPSLACYIRTLIVITNVKPEFRGRDWVTIENTLPTVLLMLHNLHTLTIRNTFERPLLWDVLPTELRSALLDLSTTPIRTITLDRLGNLPMLQFNRFSHLRRFCLLDLYMDHEHSVTTRGATTGLHHPNSKRFQHKGYLESLDIQGSTMSGRQLITALIHPQSPLSLARLRDLTLRGNSSFAHDIMVASGKALERVVWNGLGEEKEGTSANYLGSYHHSCFKGRFMLGPSSLGVMPNLTSLIISTKFARGHAHDPLPWLADALTATTTSDCASLEELTILVDFYGVWKFSITARDMLDLYEYALWPAVDAALTRPGVYASLKLVTVGLKVGGGLDTFKLLAARKMPRLMTAGILRMVYTDK